MTFLRTHKKQSKITYHLSLSCFHCYRKNLFKGHQPFLPSVSCNYHFMEEKVYSTQFQFQVPTSWHWHYPFFPVNLSAKCLVFRRSQYFVYFLAVLNSTTLFEIYFRVNVAIMKDAEAKRRLGNSFHHKYRPVTALHTAPLETRAANSPRAQGKGTGDLSGCPPPAPRWGRGGSSGGEGAAGQTRPARRDAVPAMAFPAEKALRAPAAGPATPPSRAATPDTPRRRRRRRGFRATAGPVGGRAEPLNASLTTAAPWGGPIRRRGRRRGRERWHPALGAACASEPRRKGGRGAAEERREKGAVAPAPSRPPAPPLPAPSLPSPGPAQSACAHCTHHLLGKPLPSPRRHPRSATSAQSGAAAPAAPKLERAGEQPPARGGERAGGFPFAPPPAGGSPATWQGTWLPRQGRCPVGRYLLARGRGEEGRGGGCGGSRPPWPSLRAEPRPPPPGPGGASYEGAASRLPGRGRSRRRAAVWPRAPRAGRRAAAGAAEPRLAASGLRGAGPAPRAPPAAGGGELAPARSEARLAYRQPAALERGREKGSFTAFVAFSMAQRWPFGHRCAVEAQLRWREGVLQPFY